MPKIGVVDDVVSPRVRGSGRRGEVVSVATEVHNSANTSGAVLLQVSSSLSRNRDRSLAPGTGSIWNWNGNMKFNREK